MYLHHHIRVCDSRSLPLFSPPFYAFCQSRNTKKALCLHHLLTLCSRHLIPGRKWRRKYSARVVTAANKSRDFMSVAKLAIQSLFLPSNLLVLGKVLGQVGDGVGVDYSYITGSRGRVH
jgi:hypothetical protein